MGKGKPVAIPQAREIIHCQRVNRREKDCCISQKEDFYIGLYT